MPKFLRNCFNKDYILGELKNQKLIIKIKHILLCNLLRLFFILQSGFFLYYTYGISNNYKWLFGGIPMVIILLDGFYVTIFRNGKEYAW